MSNGVEFKVEASQGVNKLIKKLNKAAQQVVSRKLGNMMLEEVTKYVPRGETGKLQTRGYVLTSGANKEGAWFKLKYRNLANLPYVMYQYNGVVYGPNKAVFTEGEHTGWVSPIAPKKPTNRILGHPKRTRIELRDGRVINITGYTKNPNAQARWLEYVRNTPTIWTPLRRKMLDETKKYIKDNLK